MHRSRQKNALLFNPWIYDFAAYDFWIKPVGLLLLGSLLRRRGWSVQLIDCLDRYHPSVRGKSKERSDGTGKFIREEIEKPAVLNDVPRCWCRYGMPPDLVRELLDKTPEPDLILVTSVMTYWYPAVRDAVKLLKEYFPHTPIMLGGIYASLCPEHAWRVVAPDDLVKGEGEQAVMNRAAQIAGDEPDFHFTHLDELPFPAYDLYPMLRSAPLLTSRGCPNRCSFCASRMLCRIYRRRSPGNVLKEIEQWRSSGVNHFAFFDDALLQQPEQYIKPLLRKIIERRLALRFHTPNGLAPRFIDEELAHLFHAAGVETIRLSFETANPERRSSMSDKVTTDDLKRALTHLEAAGYARREIGVYLLMGLPDQQPDEFRESARLVHDLGARLFPASFSPIPGTLEWRRAAAKGLWDENADLLLTNTTLFPLWRKLYGWSFCTELLDWTRELNHRLDAPNDRFEKDGSAEGTTMLCDIQQSFLS